MDVIGSMVSVSRLGSGAWDILPIENKNLGQKPSDLQGVNHFSTKECELVLTTVVVGKAEELRVRKGVS